MSRRHPNPFSRVRHRAVTSLLAMALLTPLATQAATFVVNRADDLAGASCPDDCTLRAAIRAANALNGQDTIQLGSLDITLTQQGSDENAAVSGDLDILDDLIIEGQKPGDARNIIDGAGLNDRVFHILNDAVVEFQNVSIRNGAITNGPGAGIYVSNASTVNLTNVELRDNTVIYDPSDTTVNFSQVAVSGGGIHVDPQATAVIGSSEIAGNEAPGGGGISNAGRVEVRQSLVDNNRASETGGTGSASRFSNGGGISNLGGYLTMSSTALSNNQSENQGGGLYIINQGLNLGLVIVTNSAITDNYAELNGGGIANFGPATLNNSVVANNTLGTGNGAGIYNHAANATLDVVNATVSGNSNAFSGGGVFNSHDMTLTNVTIYDNAALPCAAGSPDCGSNSQVGGNQLAMIQTSDVNLPGLTLANTIIGNNGAASTPAEPACAGRTDLIRSIGNSLSDDASCNLLHANDQAGVAGLGLDTTLAIDPGYPDTTAVHALLGGSPAINTAADSSCPVVDQRYMLRDVGACDIGAYEFGATDQQANNFVDLRVTITDSPDPAPPNDATTPLTYVVTLTNQYENAADGVELRVTLPASYSASNISMVSPDSTPVCNPPTPANVLECSIAIFPALGRAEFFISGTPSQEGTIIASAEVFTTGAFADAFLGNNRDTEETVIDAEAACVVQFNCTPNSGGGGGGGGGMPHPALLALLGLAALLRRRG